MKEPLIPLTQEEFIYLLDKHKNKKVMKKLFGDGFNKRLEDFFENE